MNSWAQQYSHIRVLSLEELRALPGPAEFDSGIYFLWRTNELVYIGKSRNLCQRAYYQATVNRYAPFHVSRTAKPIAFDCMTCLVLENDIVCSPDLDAKLAAHERAYLAAYSPLYNCDQQNGFT
jgi:hypothetical protein